MKITRIATIHASDTGMACLSGNGRSLGIGLGLLPKRSRMANVMALIGFHSAIVRTQVGMPVRGTKALERNVNGNSQMKPTLFAASGLLTERPAYAPI